MPAGNVQTGRGPLGGHAARAPKSASRPSLRPRWPRPGCAVADRVLAHVVRPNVDSMALNFAPGRGTMVGKVKRARGATVCSRATPQDSGDLDLLLPFVLSLRLSQPRGKAWHPPSNCGLRAELLSNKNFASRINDQSRSLSTAPMSWPSQRIA